MTKEEFFTLPAWGAGEDDAEFESPSTNDDEFFNLRPLTQRRVHPVIRRRKQGRFQYIEDDGQRG